MVKKTCYSCTGGIIEPDSDMFLCAKCGQHRIYKTEVIKTYRLDETELADLPRGHTTFRHNVCTYYFKPHIIELTVNKYGPDYENVFCQNVRDKKKNQETKTNERVNKIKSALESSGLIWSKYAQTDDIKQFISNGKNLTEIVKKFKQIDGKTKLLEAKLAENNLRPDGYYTGLFVNGMGDYDEQIEWDERALWSYARTEKIISTIDNLVAHLKLMRRNKLILETKLMINGLKLRSDSQICNDYIDGSTAYSLDKIVSIMKEMEFLYNQTNYAQILKETRYKYIGEQRAYGWYTHSDWDEDKVRNQAKAIALKKAKSKPNFDIVV